MEAPRKQHLDWEAAVKSMLQQIRDTFSEEVETSARVEAVVFAEVDFAATKMRVCHGDMHWH
jgi:hypothetical protein